ncbi:MAG: diaminopimelate decarboxylase [Pseudomonadota bacterium]
MHHFEYRDGVLHAEDVSLAAIAEAVGTPFYCYSTATLTRHYQVFADAFRGSDPLICYAIKANSNQAVIRTLADLGAGMDVVSEGELRRAFAAGVAAERIIFAGVGKTRDEMAFALAAGIRGFNVESAAELEALSDVASAEGRTAHVALRVNPDVDAGTHEKISTGKAENKFGIAYEDAAALYARADALPGIIADGVHMHIGSQITDLAPFRKAFERLATLVKDLRHAGRTITHLDLGGGLGVPYRGTNDVPPHPDEYAAVVRETVGDLDVALAFEPGRMIAANAGILVAQVIYLKDTAIGPDAGVRDGGDAYAERFVIADGAMNDLIRPTLYDAHHDILPVRKPDGSTPELICDVVGPVCETGDYLARGRRLPDMAAGDLFAVMTAGAYGAVQAGTYNTRPLVPEVMVNGAEFAVVRPRQTYDELIGLDQMPDWLTGTG